MTTAQSYDDQRRHPRRELRIPGAAHVLCNSEVRAIEVWTRNISEGGVCLLSQQELQGDRMILELPMPEYAEKLIECEVKHRSRYDRLKVDGTLETSFVCGLQFVRVRNKHDFHDSLLLAFEHDAPPHKTDTPCDDESLMPLLSAIGLAVVYASRLPVI